MSVSPFASAHRLSVRTGVSIAVLALLAVGGATGCSSRGSDSGKSASSEAPAASASASADDAPAEQAPSEPGVGQAVKVGDLEFTVTAVEEAGTEVGNEYLNQTAQGRFVAVVVKVTNIGSKSETFFSDYVQLVDSAERTFDSDSTATIYAAPSADSWINDINPGNSFEGRVIFDLPADATASAVIVKDNAFSGGERIRVS